MTSTLLNLFLRSVVDIGIPTSTSHKSPDEILDIIKKCVDEYIDVPETLEIEECKKSLMKSEIPIKIVFGFWGLNNVVERLS